MPQADIESIDHEGRGVARVEGKAIFIEGGLPGERVAYSSYRKKSSYEQAVAVAIVRASSQRVEPRCRHFGTCGGCSMQHLVPAAQTAAKQRVLEDALWHLARLRPEVLYAPISGSPWCYRYRARLAVHLLEKTGVVLVGFHERRSSHVADMDSCEVLPAEISRLLPPLRGLLAGLSCPDRLPQIEVSIGDMGGTTQRVLVLRHLQALAAGDEAQLRSFADKHRIVFYLQPGGPDSARLLHPANAPELAYDLPEFGIRVHFRPTDFTQVNLAINRMLVRRAVALLRPEPGELIGDMFCGLGNFTLPIASTGARVVGSESHAGLIERARQNAQRNGLAARCDFRVGNLFAASAASIAALGIFAKMLIDPPREGAQALAKALSELAARGDLVPARIVYVSCNPATLSRDAAILVHQGGYRLRGAGIANMFPQTSHVESIALFER